jgi:signal transduction histidine kinase
MAMDLISIALDARQTAQPRASEKSISIEVHDDESLPFVLADRDAMRRVFDNLITNAIKYTLDGGLISISFTQTKTHVYTHIGDTGVGIEEEDLKHIFDRFYRIKVPGRQETGTGLGLSIVQILVEDHEGHVSACSTPGQGTVFTFSLPRFSPEDITYASTETHSRY